MLNAGAQTLTVMFNPTDTTDYSPATKSVTLTVNKAEPSLTWLAPASITYGTPLSSTQLDAAANVAGNFNYVPAAGTLLAAGTHKLNVTFTPADTTDYATAGASVLLQVTHQVPVITWAPPAAISYGTALSPAQLDATANVPGAFSYTPAAGTVLAPGTHKLNVTFTPANTTDYSAASASVTLQVTRQLPVITWPTPAPISYGTALSSTQLDATANVPGTFSYTPAGGTVLTPGTHKLNVTFTPANTTDYSAASAYVLLEVTRQVPVITWTPPAAITSGTALSSTQLDATANVPGTFSYTPAAGTVLTAGTHKLNVTFTPANTTDYSTASASVLLQVNP